MTTPERREELNYRLDVADRLISKWECGLRTSTSFNLYCWADALDAKLKVVANDNEKPPISIKKKMVLIANDNLKLQEVKKVA